jgi:hypothetical protein
MKYNIHPYGRVRSVLPLVTMFREDDFVRLPMKGANVCRKGCGLSPTVDRSEVWLGKKNGFDE